MERILATQNKGLQLSNDLVLNIHTTSLLRAFQSIDTPIITSPITDPSTDKIAEKHLKKIVEKGHTKRALSPIFSSSSQRTYCGLILACKFE